MVLDLIQRDFFSLSGRSGLSKNIITFGVDNSSSAKKMYLNS